MAITALPTQVAAQNNCINHEALIGQLIDYAKNQEKKAPEFRIAKKDNGQSLLYWHFGETTGNFYATTFKSDGCAILAPTGEARRFKFPKTAFNTGVFFEMDLYKREH